MRMFIVTVSCLLLGACSQAVLNAGAQIGKNIAAIECAKLSKNKPLVKLCKTAAGAIITVATAQSQGLMKK